MPKIVFEKNPGSQCLDSTLFSPESLWQVVKTVAEEKKAQNLVQLDVGNVSPLTHFMGIASGTSSRHLKEMAFSLRKEIQKLFGFFPRIEADPEYRWVLVDAGDVMVHLMHPEVRDTYQLEVLWS